MPFARGSAALGEWLCGLLLKKLFPEHKGLELFDRCSTADIDALSASSFEEFLPEYRKRF